MNVIFDEMADERERYEALYVIVDEIWDLFFTTLQVRFDGRHTPYMTFRAWSTLQERNRSIIQTKLDKPEYSETHWFIQKLNAWKGSILRHIIDIFGNGISYKYNIVDLEVYRDELRGEINRRVANSKPTK